MIRSTRVFVGIGFVLSVLFVSFAHAADRDERHAADVAWARTVAEDFIACVKRGNGTQALALCTDSLRSSAATTRLVDGPVTALTEDFKDWRIPPKFTLDTHSLSPDANEIRFVGTIKGSNQGTVPYLGTIILRLVNEGGKWRVAFFAHRYEEK